MFSFSTRTPISCRLTLLILLITLVAPLSSQAATDGSVGRALLGGTMTAGGFAAVGLASERRMNGGGHEAYQLTFIVPVLLTPGIPLLCFGILQGIAGDGMVDDPANLRLWERAIVARALFAPCIVVGGVLGMVGLAQGAYESQWRSLDYPSYLLPMFGFSVFGMGLGIAADGDAALLEMGGRESSLTAPPGAILLGAGVVAAAIGTGILTSFTVIGAPIFSGEVPNPPAIAAMCGTVYIIGGITCIIAGDSRQRRYRAGWPGLARLQPRKSLLHIDGMAPTFDALTETTGMAIVGRF